MRTLEIVKPLQTFTRVETCKFTVRDSVYNKLLMKCVRNIVQSFWLQHIHTSREESMILLYKLFLDSCPYLIIFCVFLEINFFYILNLYLSNK